MSPPPSSPPTKRMKSLVCCGKKPKPGTSRVLLITHKFREVMAFTDEVTVLRKGHLAGHGMVKDLTVADMAHMMLGEERQTKDVPKIRGLRQERPSWKSTPWKPTKTMA